MSQIDLGLQSFLPQSSLNKNSAGKSASKSNSTSFSDIVKDKNMPQEAKVTSASNHSKVNESKPEKSLQSRAQTATDEDAKPKTVTRQQAMSIFLQRMESELGVAPEDLIGAFAELDEDSLMLTPESSASALIEQLNLGPKDQEHALALYQGMLATTAAGNMAGYLGQTGQTAQLSVMSEAESRTHELRNSLDQMNDKFFMRGSFSQQHQAPQAVDTYERMSRMTQMPPDLNANTASIGSGDTLTQSELYARLMSAQDPQANADEAIPLPVMGTAKEGLAQQNAQTTTTPLPELFGINTNSQAADADLEVFNLQKILTPSAPAAEATTSELDGLSSMVAGLNSEDGFNSDESFAGSEGFDGADEFTNLNANALNSKGEIVSTKTAFAFPTPEVTEADVQENVKEIINQAQFLSKKGGGEMKLNLSPEGIGDLSLKVKMQNGQIDVEMVTSNDAAKKMLERGLGELKESMALHKLQLDNIKIENAKDVSNQLADQRQDLERSFQQKFMNDFRDRNQSMRNEFFDVGSPRAVKSQTQDEASNTTYTYGKKRKEANARRLDLVA